MADDDPKQVPKKHIFDNFDQKSSNDSNETDRDERTRDNQWNNNPYTMKNDHQYRNAREYAQALQTWLWQYRFFSAMNAFHAHLVTSMPASLSQPQPALNQQTTNQQRNQSAWATPEPARNVNETGTRYWVPMLWRRVAAECLDFILLFYVKILVTVAVLRQMGYMNENFLDVDDQIPLLADLGDLDYEKMLGFTSELIALEVVNRVCITIVETLCIRQGYAGAIGGATPGKKIMQLRVISYNDITDLRNGQIIVTGERDPGFFNALVRSVIKNFSMAFFFPACFTVFFFRFNRAAYDVLAHTIVVEVERPRN